MANMRIGGENLVVVITPFNLRHRSFISHLEKNLIKVGAVLVDRSRPKSNLRSLFSLSRILGSVLTAYEFFKLGILSVRDIPVHAVTSLADSKISEIVSRISPKLVIVYGGKVIPKSTLDSLGFPCINVHGSVLPGYRGLDSYWWSLVEKNKDLRGYSIHFVNPGIDTGDLLLVKPYPLTDLSFPQHLYWRIWISQDSAKEISKIIQEGRETSPGIPHSRTASVYRSRIKLADILMAKSKFRLRRG